MTDETNTTRKHGITAECEEAEGRISRIKANIKSQTTTRDQAQGMIESLSVELAEEQDKLLDLYRKRVRKGAAQ